MLHALRQLADRHRPVSLARERTLPVIDALGPLFAEGGLRRGATVVVTGSTAVLLALLAGPSTAGSWCAVVGLPWFGATAAAQLGVALERVALVPRPGREWPAVVAALVDGFDVVAVAGPGRVRTGDAHRLNARARERGTVLVSVGDDWPGAEVTVRAGPSQWVGLGDGHGSLLARCLSVTVEGRRGAVRPRHGSLWLPDANLAVRTGSNRGPTDASSASTLGAPVRLPARQPGRSRTGSPGRPATTRPDQRATGPPDHGFRRTTDGGVVASA